MAAQRAFQFTRRGAGTLALEPGEGGRLTETFEDGSVFEIGRVRVWEPGQRLVLSWRQKSFAPDQQTEVHVSFEAVGQAPDIDKRHSGALRLGRHRRRQRRQAWLPIAGVSAAPR